MNTIVRKNGSYYPTLFDSVFGKNTLDQFFVPDYSANKPAVNVIESENGYRIELAVPGLKKEDFKIGVDGDKLTISAEKKNESEEKGDKGEKYSRKEFSYQSFQRAFTLPETVDAEKISAAYEAGILNISVPKKELPAAPSPRQIEIA